MCVCMSIYAFECMCAYVFFYRPYFVCVGVYMRVMYVCMYVCIYICVCVHACMCIYLFILFIYVSKHVLRKVQAITLRFLLLMSYIKCSPTIHTFAYQQTE